MTRGRLASALAINLLALAVAMCAFSSGLAQAPKRALLDELLARFAKVQSLKARFQEEKHMALLVVPLRSEGVLYYERPRRLARHTERPQKSSLLLTGQELSFGDAAHRESLDLAAQPAVRVLVDTFVGVLAGDGAALARLAKIEAEALPEGAFRIRVTPTDPGVLRIVRSMTFEGKGAELSRMELLDANGDRTVTTFSELRFGAKLNEAESAQIFRIGG